MKNDVKVPAIYQVEVSNNCNLKCSFCPRFQKWAKRKEGFFNPMLLSRIDWSETNYVELQLSGEPMLHPQLMDIVEWLISRGIKVGMSTNGTFLHKFERKDLEKFYAITVNEDMFREKPTLLGNTVVQNLGRDYPIEDYSHKKKKEIPNCLTPFEYISIQYDGDVVPCCKAHGKQIVFGNLYKESFEEIINSQKREQFLISVLDKKENGLCEFCSVPNPHQIHYKIKEVIESRKCCI